MSDEEIFELAKMAGLNRQPCPLGITVPFWSGTDAQLLTFARLVREQSIYQGRG